MKLLLPYIAIILMLVSCTKKKPDAIPDTTDSGNTESLTIEWKIRTDTSGLICDGREPLLWNNKLLWSNAPLGQGFRLILSDAATGSEIWTWNNFIHDADFPYFNYHFIFEGRYCFNNIQETHSIDLNTGLSAWQNHNSKTAAYISLAGGYLYGKLNNSNYRPKRCVLRRSKVDAPGWEEILSLDASDLSGYSPAIFGPSLWLSKTADSILVFQNRSWNFNSGDGQIDLYAYNINQDKLHFDIKDLEPSGNSNVLSPLIDGDRVYLLGQKNLHCVDLNTGAVLWQKGFPGNGHHLMLSSLVIDGNRIIVKPDNDPIYAFNKYSGGLIWSTVHAGSSPSHLYQGKGSIFYTSDADGKLYGVRTSDGFIFMSEDSPNLGNTAYPGAAFHGGLAVNKERGLLYVHDHYFMMAIKIPSPI